MLAKTRKPHYEEDIKEFYDVCEGAVFGCPQKTACVVESLTTKALTADRVLNILRSAWTYPRSKHEQSEKGSYAIPLMDFWSLEQHEASFTQTQASIERLYGRALNIKVERLSEIATRIAETSYLGYKPYSKFCMETWSWGYRYHGIDAVLRLLVAVNPELFGRIVSQWYKLNQMDAVARMGRLVEDLDQITLYTLEEEAQARTILRHAFYCNCVLKPEDIKYWRFMNDELRSAILQNIDKNLQMETLPQEIKQIYKWIDEDQIRTGKVYMHAAILPLLSMMQDTALTLAFRIGVIDFLTKKFSGSWWSGDQVYGYFEYTRGTRLLAAKKEVSRALRILSQWLDDATDEPRVVRNQVIEIVSGFLSHKNTKLVKQLELGVEFKKLREKLLLAKANKQLEEKTDVADGNMGSLWAQFWSTPRSPTTHSRLVQAPFEPMEML